MPGTLFVVATPIGNLEDISIRALGVLRRVSLIAAEDTRRTGRLLSHFGIDTPTTSLHEHNERQKSASLLERLGRGEDLAIVSDAGTPTVSDPGQHLIRAAAASGVRVEAIPGPSAVTAALAASGLPADRFTFMGFPPTRGAPRREWWRAFRSIDHVAVFFEAPHRIQRTLNELLTEVGDVWVVVGRELTKAHEELVRGPISEILRSSLRAQGEFTIVVQPVANMAQPAAAPPSDGDLLSEFNLSVQNDSLTRREAIGLLAKKYSMTSKQVYDSLERAKHLVK